MWPRSSFLYLKLRSCRSRYLMLWAYEDPGNSTKPFFRGTLQCRPPQWLSSPGNCYVLETRHFFSPLSQSISESLRSFCDPHQCAKVILIQPYPVPNLTSWVFGKPQETTGWLLDYPKLVTNGSPFRCFILMIHGLPCVLMEGSLLWSLSPLFNHFFTIFYPFFTHLTLNHQVFLSWLLKIHPRKPQVPCLILQYPTTPQISWIVPGKVPELHRFKSRRIPASETWWIPWMTNGYHQWIRGKIHAMELGIFIAKSTN